MPNSTSEANFARHMRRITEVDLWELVDTGRENVKNTGVTDDVITRYKTEYSSHPLAEVMNGINRNKQVLGAISRIGK